MNTVSVIVLLLFGSILAYALGEAISGFAIRRLDKTSRVRANEGASVIQFSKRAEQVRQRAVMINASMRTLEQDIAIRR